GGKLLGQEHFILDGTAEQPLETLFAAFIEQFYTARTGESAEPAPGSVLALQRGERADYMRLVKKNAEQNLKTFLIHQEVQESAQATALTELAAALDLPEPP